MEFIINNGLLEKYNGESVDITIPDTVSDIAEGAFDGCLLRTVTFPPTLKKLTVAMPKTLESVVFSDGTETIENAFAECSNLKQVRLPSTLKVIGDNVFSQCTFLGEIDIPDGVVSIGDMAFNRCIFLKSVTLPHGATSIGKSAFSGCSMLESIDIPDTVVSIGEMAFYLCGNLKSVVVPSGVASIGKGVFSFCNSLESVSIPHGVISIGEIAFDGCSALKSIHLPDSAAFIGQEAFGGCKSLTDVKTKYFSPFADTPWGRKIIEQINAELSAKLADRVNKGVCFYCGSKFKFSLKKAKECSQCDYYSDKSVPVAEQERFAELNDNPFYAALECASTAEQSGTPKAYAAFAALVDEWLDRQGMQL